MKKEQKERVLNELNAVIKPALKNIDNINAYILELSKKINILNDEEMKSKNYLTINEKYKQKQTLYTYNAYYERELKSELLNCLDSILYIFFANVKNKRDKSDFEAMFEYNGDCYPLGVEFRFYTSDHQASIYLTLNGYNHYSEKKYFSSKIIKSEWNGTNWAEVTQYNNFKEEAEAIKENQQNAKKTKVLNLEQLAEEVAKIKEMNERHKAETEALMNKHREETNKKDKHNLTLIVK